jgi:hypothetical protein
MARGMAGSTAIWHVAGGIARQQTVKCGFAAQHSLRSRQRLSVLISVGGSFRWVVGERRCLYKSGALGSFSVCSASRWCKQRAALQQRRPLNSVHSSSLLRSSQPKSHEIPPNAGQQVRSDRAERSDDQGRVQERAQRIGREEAYFEALGVPCWEPEERTAQKLRQYLSK